LLTDGAVEILDTADPALKAALSHRLAAAWRAGSLPPGLPGRAPRRPARPPKPVLLAPRDMPKRRAGGGAASRVAMLHALAHIELNAIDLAWDLIARFAAPGPGFHDDWVRVADEEATHFGLLQARLAASGAAYGDLPAHDGLWQAAEATSGDLAARLAVVPMVLEARGLDVTPGMIRKFAGAGDPESAAVLETVLRDEIGHVAIGRHWFGQVIGPDDPATAWQALVQRYYGAALKLPFNDPARAAAGMPIDFYGPLAE